VLSVSCTTITQPTASFTSTINNTAKQIEKADHTEQKALRKSTKSLILSYFLFLIVSGSKTQERSLYYHWYIWFSDHMYPKVTKITCSLRLVLTRSCPYYFFVTQWIWREPQYWTYRSWFFSLQITWLPCTTAQDYYNLGYDAIMDWYWFGQTCRIKEKYTRKCYPNVLWEQHIDFGCFKWYLDKYAVYCLLNSLFLTEWLKIGSILIIQASTRHKRVIQAIDFFMEKSL